MQVREAPRSSNASNTQNIEEENEMARKQLDVKKAKNHGESEQIKLVNPP
jgi:hypothetical protein